MFAVQDYEDFDLANENDSLEEFLGSPKIENNIQSSEKAETKSEVVENGKAGSREPSAEVEGKPAEATNGGGSNHEAENIASSEPQTEESTAEATATEAAPTETKPHEENRSDEAVAEASASEPPSKTEEEIEGDGADE